MTQNIFLSCNYLRPEDLFTMSHKPILSKIFYFYGFLSLVRAAKITAVDLEENTPPPPPQKIGSGVNQSTTQ